MITHVQIQNFKSVPDLSFEAKRVNVFIGEPNTGKTNILEALALLSEGVHGPAEFKESFRFRSVADLFSDQQVTTPITVATSECHCALSFDGQQFQFAANGPRKDDQGQHYSLNQTAKETSLDILRSLEKQAGSVHPTAKRTEWANLQYGIKYYRFKTGAPTANQAFGVLQPPFGANLASVLYTNKGLRSRVSDLFRSRNFRLEIRPVENELRIEKRMEDESLTFSFPYESVSETWRRLVFFMAVLETNHDSTLLLDEPEANTFPLYTAYLAERIALDDSNQFFLTTHNPYVLGSIVAKTPVRDLAVFVATMENFRTNLKPVPVDGLSKILDYGPDAFLNLDKITEA